MNAFIHRTLKHYLQAEEGGDSLLGGSTDPQPSTTTQAPASDADTLAELNKTETVDDPTKTEETPEAKDAREAKEAQVPETYADFTMPEGVEVDTAMLAEFGTVAKELGLTQAQAQKLVDLQAKAALAGETGRQEYLEQALKAQSDKWVAEIKNDPDLGGAKFDATVTTAVKAINTFFGDDFRQLLNDSGIGNNPALIRGMYKIGAAISEDKMVIPGSDASATEEPSAAAAMFGDVKFD